MKFFTKWKILGFAIGVTIAVWLILAAGPESAPPLPKVTLVSIEPAEMTDESGTALLLVTFTVSVEQRTYLKDVGKVIEPRGGKSLGGARGAMPVLSYSSTLYSPRQQYEGLLLVPVGKTSCRVSMKYAAAVRPVFNQLSTYVLARLPQSIRRQIFNRTGMKPFTYQYVPGKWRETLSELALPL